jgi:hypothetical protein
MTSTRHLRSWCIAMALLALGLLACDDKPAGKGEGKSVIEGGKPESDAGRKVEDAKQKIDGAEQQLQDREDRVFEQSKGEQGGRGVP